MTVDDKKKFDNGKININKLNEAQLVNFIEEIKSEIAKLRNKFGIRVDNNLLVELAEKILGGDKNKVTYISKIILEIYFKRYELIMPRFNQLPLHARIAIDPGYFRQKHPEVDFFILEAAIYEDMCNLFNLAKNIYAKLEFKNEYKKEIKTYHSLSRATIVTSFNFLEAYLNGIAYDYYYINHHNLDDKTKMILTEYDHLHNKQKFISLREKILQYPKIIIGSAHPPLQESNCKELAYVLENAKIMRDSIVHASAIPGTEKKEDKLFHIDFNDTENIVDNIIILIKKIEQTIEGNLDYLFWLYERNSNGLFPEEVFE